MKRLIVLVLLGLLSVVVLLSCDGRGPVLRAATVGVYYPLEDGDIYGDASQAYVLAWQDSDGCDLAGLFGVIGQKMFNWRVSAAYLGFDTSGIPDTATVVSATLRVMAHLDVSNADFDVKVLGWSWATDLCTNREGNYDGRGAGTVVGTLRNTSAGWVSGTVYSLVISPTSVISITGVTKFVVASGEDLSASEPGGSEYVQIFMAEMAGTACDPVLEVGYEIPATATPTDTLTPTPTNTLTSTPTDTLTPTPTNTLTSTPTDTPTPTPTNTLTPTPTATPTVTPACAYSVSANTSWGPGTVRLRCNVGIMSGVYLTITAGTEVVMTGDLHWDVFGDLYAVGTAVDPITFTRELTTSAGSWGPVWVRHDGDARFEYSNVYYGRGVNDYAGSIMRFVNVMTNTYGLATLAASDVMSSTFQYNGIGLLVYYDGSPSISACNVLSNTIDAEVQQAVSVIVPGCWWGADPPDDELVWDYYDEFTRGILVRDDHAAAWVSW